jgi:hypothetical protein
MDIDQLLTEVPQVPTQENKMKERLVHVHVVASGKSKDYFGKPYSTNEIENLDEKELTKLYARYEAVLGGLITKTFKNHMCFAYTRAVEFICPTVSNGRFVLANTNELNQSLVNGPFIDLALTSLTCKLYHEYGHFLAPIETMLLTSNYVQPAAVQQDGQQNTASYKLTGQQNAQQNTANYQQVEQQLAQQNATKYQLATQQNPTSYTTKFN